MLAVKGTYDNGRIFLQEEVKTTELVEIIVTFIEDADVHISKKIDLAKFSFNKSRELLKDYSGSLSDAVIEERRSVL